MSSTVRGQIWIADDESESGYSHDGDTVKAYFESTDENEIALHIGGEDSSDALVSFYLTHQEAFRLSALAGARLMDDGNE